MHTTQRWLIAITLGFGFGTLLTPAAAQQAVTDTDAAFKAYLAAWHERDSTKRRELLEPVFAVDGTYTDPRSHVEGREQLVRHIGRVMVEIPPGIRAVQASPIDKHHGVVRVNWKMVRSNGSVFLEGADFIELDDQGRMRRIVGFFGPLASTDGAQ